MSILVIDVGTSGLRAAVVDADAAVHQMTYRPAPPDTPSPGLVEFDPRAMASAVLDVARTALGAWGPVDAVGIANQRTSTVVWDRATGEPIGPGIGWQDLRTVLDCLTLAGSGIRLSPNQSATKVQWLLNTFDAARSRDLCFGTVDTWLAWTLTEGRAHVIDATNAAVTGLLDGDLHWDDKVLAALDIPMGMLPRVVDSTGIVGAATALPGAPPLAGLAGDQQCSLLGQGCVRPGDTKITFGTGGMLDVCLGPVHPEHTRRGAAGTFPIVAWQAHGQATWGAEAIMLSAGANVDWLVEDLGLIVDPAQSHAVASACDDTDGVVYVPALLGLGTPMWDYGARGTLLGITRGTGRPQIVRAVLEGIAQRGADLVEAVEADTGVRVARLRVDGGMSVNPTFVQALADATARPVEVSPVVEATTLGAAFLAGLAVGTWPSVEALAETWRPDHTVAPQRQLDRARWAEAIERARRWIPDLSAVDF